MNCQRFENSISDLARNQIMDADLRNETTAHCDECDDCHLRLRDERMLGQSLRSLAVEMKELEAPARIESELLLAFRAQKVVVPMRPRPAYTRYIVAAVAAVLLVVVGVVAFSLNGLGEQKQIADITPQPAQQQAPVVPAPTPRIVDQKELVSENGSHENDRIEIVHRPRRSATARSRPADEVLNHPRSEVATDFMPIGYMNPATIQDGAQIIRVEMPRSALANFGYVVNMERANQRVKADVLLGSDGMAHAIRFVQ